MKCNTSTNWAMATGCAPEPLARIYFVEHNFDHCLLHIWWPPIMLQALSNTCVASYTRCSVLVHQRVDSHPVDNVLQPVLRMMVMSTMTIIQENRKFPDWVQTFLQCLHEISASPSLFALPLWFPRVPHPCSSLGILTWFPFDRLVHTIRTAPSSISHVKQSLRLFHCTRIKI